MKEPILKPFWQIKDIVQITGLSRSKVMNVLAEANLKRFGKGGGYYSMDVVKIFEMEEWYSKMTHELLTSELEGD